MYEQIVDTLTRASFSLFTLGLCAISFTTMNIMRMIERGREKARLAHEMNEKSSRIPQSSLKGIEALPVELWSQILGYLLDPYLRQKKLQCCDLAEISELRLVCCAFDKETQRALHQRLTLSQIPYHSFLLPGTQKPSGWDHSLRNSLLASALYRETQCYAVAGIAHPMVYRIKNCVLVAQHLSSTHDLQAEQLLYRKFCTVASASCYCWSYIFTLRYDNNHNSRTFIHGVDDCGRYQRERDILLEVSLLVVTGYKLADVRRWMARLGRLGMLVGYREHAVTGPQRHLHGYSNAHVQVHYRRWPQGLVGLAEEQRIGEEIEEQIVNSVSVAEREVDEEFEDLERRFDV